MEIRVLRYFLAVAREESITRASEVLHITQPTLSKQLMELEEKLGTKLFVRGNRKISLTEDGVFLRKRAQEIIDLVDKTSADICNDDELLTGEINIGGGESEGMRIIARAAKTISMNHPFVHYNLFSGNAEAVMERLDKGLIDFGLVIGPTDIKKYDYLQLPYHDTWGLVMPKDCQLAKKEYLVPEDLLAIPVLCSRQAMLDEIAGWAGLVVDNINIVGTYNLIYNAALMVEEGVGYALCLDKLARTSCENSLTFRPFHPLIKSNLYIVWKKYQAFSKAARLFLETLQAEISQAETPK